MQRPAMPLSGSGESRVIVPADAKCGNQLVDRQSAEADKREADPFFQGPGLDGISRLWSGSIAPSLFLGRDELCELRSE